MRAVTIAARGHSITEIYLEIQNCLDRPLNLFIPAGTYVRAQGSHQNMAVRKEIALAVGAREFRFIKAPAACINAGKPIPGKDDRFRGVAKVGPQVERFLKETPHQPPMVVQAGVWALTDGYNRRQIQDRLLTESSTRVSSSVSDADIDVARAILDRLGIHSSLSD
jgi:hypothetical protein